MRPDLQKQLERYTLRDEDSGCWNWIGAGKPTGYGYATLDDGQDYAHRVAYLAYIGEIPKGLTIDHLCRNRACINPEHLEAVTMRTNILRGDNPAARNARKTHCKRGHEFTPENVYVVKLRNGKTGRHCKACQTMRNRGLQLDTPVE